MYAVIVNKDGLQNKPPILCRQQLGATFGVQPYTMKKNIKLFTLILCFAAGATAGCRKQQALGDKDVFLPGRHMSEHQVADIAFRELTPNLGFRCEFTNGVWDILEVQKGVYGIASVVTNADGKIFVTSTNASRVVLRVRDVDGKVEQVKTP